MSNHQSDVPPSVPKKKRSLYPLHIVIGLSIMIIFWILKPIEPITPLGMRCLGTFLSMIYLWSTVEAMWPSILGLFMLGLSGYSGDTGFNGVWLNAIGSPAALLALFTMILFGAVDEVGDTKYIARWFLTRKIFKGRPYTFIAIFFLCCYVLSALTDPIVSLVILWPIALRLMALLNIERHDNIWAPFFVGMFIVTALGQPLFPFKGPQMVPVSAFAGMTAQAGNPQIIPTIPYMLVNIIMTFIIMALYLLILKFIFRVDVSKLKAVDPAQLEKQFSLPKINFQQKVYLYMIPCYLLMMLLPSFIKNNPVSNLLNTLGSLGITLFWIALFVIVRWNGKPLLNFKEVANNQLNWGVFFMISAAIYGVNTLANPSTGITDFLIQLLNPVLGGQSEIVFVAVMFTVALFITNFANNGAMATVLMPVVLSFSQKMNIAPAPVAMGVILMVFVAMLTPAASPQAGMMHGRKDIYSTREILSIAFPMCILTLLAYIFIGYPLCKFLINLLIA